jgi:hypothetical protein
MDYYKLTQAAGSFKGTLLDAVRLLFFESPSKL